MTEKVHPDFAAAPDERRWAKSLAGLAGRLSGDAWRRRGEWASYVLPRGAIISMRVNPDTFRKELRIRRNLRRAWTDKSQNAWATEVGVFLSELECATWKLVTDRHEPGGAVGVDGLAGGTVEVVYEEPGALGAPKPMLRCAHCGTEFEEHPGDRVYRQPVPCQACAFKLGAQEVAQRRAATLSSSPPEGAL